MSAVSGAIQIVSGSFFFLSGSMVFLSVVNKLAAACLFLFSGRLFFVAFSGQLISAYIKSINAHINFIPILNTFNCKIFTPLY